MTAAMLNGMASEIEGHIHKADLAVAGELAVGLLEGAESLVESRAGDGAGDDLGDEVGSGGHCGGGGRSGDDDGWC